MKMIKSMNPRSIKFVTLRSAMGCAACLRRKLRAMDASPRHFRFRLKLQSIGERAGKVFQFDDHVSGVTEQMVVTKHGRDCHHEARDRREHGAGDARRELLNSGGLLGCN